jgi:hypothetical protein
VIRRNDSSAKTPAPRAAEGRTAAAIASTSGSMSFVDNGLTVTRMPGGR